jgi:hypothetical protein
VLEENPPSLPDFGPLPSRSLPKLPRVAAKTKSRNKL